MPSTASTNRRRRATPRPPLSRNARRRGRAPARRPGSTSCSPTPPSGAARAASSSRAPWPRVGAGVARHPRQRRAPRRRRSGPSSRASPPAARSWRRAKGDRRFADPAWESNWLLRRVLQAYLAVGETVDGADRRRRARLARPSARRASRRATCSTRSRRRTSRWSNPAVLQGDRSTRAAPTSCAAARRFAADVSRPPRLPASVDTSGFEVGGNLAVTPGLGRAAHRGLRADPVRAARPSRSARCRCCSSRRRSTSTTSSTSRRAAAWSSTSSRQGQQVFVISWRNPDDGQGHFDLDTYADAVLEARDAVAEITRPDRRCTSTRPARAGSSPPARSATSPPSGALGEVASLTLFVCALDNERAGHGGGARQPRGWRPPRSPSRPARGYLDGQALAGVFAWLRPERPGLELRRQQLPARQGAAGVRRPLLEPGHRAPGRRPAPRLRPPRARQLARAPRRRWRCSARRSTSARSTSTATSSPGSTTTSSRGRTRTAARSCSAATTRFVLSTQRPHPGARQPAERRSRARATASPTSTPAEPAGVPRAGADAAAAAGGPTTSTGSRARSGELRPAPEKLGSRKHSALGKAPGTYVHAS